MSFKAEVIADGSGKWVGNGLAFASEAEAQAYVEDLMWRWTAVRETRVVACAGPASHVWVDGVGAQRLEKSG